MNKFILSLFAFGFLYACDKDNTKTETTTQEQNQQALSRLLSEIKSLAVVDCNDSSSWEITYFGSKPCGGPTFYIAYPKKIKTTFLEKTQKYTQAEDDLNKKWGLVSDCAFNPHKIKVTCSNGETLEY